LLAQGLVPRTNPHVTAVVDFPSRTGFRYLATGGVWFDDHGADGVDANASVIHL
jgi:hypothetical protein